MVDASPGQLKRFECGDDGHQGVAVPPAADSGTVDAAVPGSARVSKWKWPLPLVVM